MSRIGKKPIKIKEGVEVVVAGKKIAVSGPEGELSYELPPQLAARVENGEIVVERKIDTKRARALHGLAARLVSNMVSGASVPWSKTLELVGAGFRAKLEEGALILSLGFSHPVKISPPTGISLEVAENKITVRGADRGLVGQTAAKIRAARPPEPYKGKGVRYASERVRRKPGKAVKAGPAPA